MKRLVVDIEVNTCLGVRIPGVDVDYTSFTGFKKSGVVISRKGIDGDDEGGREGEEEVERGRERDKDKQRDGGRDLTIEECGEQPLHGQQCSYRGLFSDSSLLPPGAKSNASHSVYYQVSGESKPCSGTHQLSCNLCLLACPLRCSVALCTCNNVEQGKCGQFIDKPRRFAVCSSRQLCPKEQSQVCTTGRK